MTLIPSFESYKKTALKEIIYTSIPDRVRWKADTKLSHWCVNLRVPSDPLFDQVNNALENCQVKSSRYVVGFPQHRLPYVHSLIRLYLVCCKWMREHTKVLLGAKTMGKWTKSLYVAKRLLPRMSVVTELDAAAKRMPAVRALSLFAAKKLMQQIQCQGVNNLQAQNVDALDKILQKAMSLEMSFHGWSCDLNYYVNEHLSPWVNDSEAEQYRITFRGGLAYCWPWHSPNSDPITQELCHTPKWMADRHKAFQGAAQGAYQKGVFGFALTNNYKFYGGPHISTTHKYGKMTPLQFHSSTVSGKPVLCTGCIGIENGVVMYINNFSGHYQPSAARLGHVIDFLRMQGVKLDHVQVACLNEPQKNGTVPEFLETVGADSHMPNLDLKADAVLT